MVTRRQPARRLRDITRSTAAGMMATIPRTWRTWAHRATGISQAKEPSVIVDELATKTTSSRVQVSWADRARTPPPRATRVSHGNGAPTSRPRLRARRRRRAPTGQATVATSSRTRQTPKTGTSAC